jgi:hypothetical protein
VSTPAEDKALEEYLRRKSALSMGYRKLYIEAPPPELDQAVKARAKRALRWLIPGIVSLVAAIGLIFGTIYVLQKWLDALVAREQALKQEYAEIMEKKRQEELKKPMLVAIDAETLTPKTVVVQMTREQWRAHIESLRSAGKIAEADAELARYREAYPTGP